MCGHSISVEDIASERHDSGDVYVLEGEVTTRHSSLQDGYTWGKPINFGLKKPNTRTNYKFPEYKVECPQADTTEELYLKGSHHSRCEGALTCSNEACPYYLIRGVRNTKCARATGYTENSIGIGAKCNAPGGLGCRENMTSVAGCTALRYRIVLETIGRSERFTVICYRHHHSPDCARLHESTLATAANAKEYNHLTTVGERVTQGIKDMTMAVVKGVMGKSEEAHKYATAAKQVTLCTTEADMSRVSRSGQSVNAFRPEEIARQLMSTANILILPYHVARDACVNLPEATVTLYGCCRTQAQWDMVSAVPSYKYAAVWLILASSDNRLLRSLLDPLLLEAMAVAVSFDNQHCDKVRGYFSQGYFSYVPMFQKLVNLSMVMIPAQDMHRGYKATLGDNSLGNSTPELES